MTAVDTIRLRGGVASLWTTVNPVLGVREVGVETDTLKMKLGDGVTAWTGLPYSYDAQGFAQSKLLTMPKVTYRNLPTTGLRYYHHAGGLSPFGSGVRNALSAQRWARNLGAWILDFDVRSTLDNVLVNCHESTTLTSSANNIATMPDGTANPLVVTPELCNYTQLPQLDQRLYVGPGWAPEDYLTIEKALQDFGGQAMLSFELKSGNQLLTPLAALVNKYGLADSCYVNFASGGEAFAPTVLATGMQVYIYTVSSSAAVTTAVAAGAKLISIPVSAASSVFATAAAAAAADPTFRYIAEGTTGVSFGLINRQETAKIVAGTHGYVSDVMDYLDQTTPASSIADACRSGRIASGWVPRTAYLLPTVDQLSWLGPNGLIVASGGIQMNHRTRDFGATAGVPITVPFTVIFTAAFETKPTATTQYVGLRMGTYDDDGGKSSVATSLGGVQVVARANGSLAIQPYTTNNYTVAGILAPNLTTSAPLTSGVPITAIPIVALTAAIRAGTTYTVAAATATVSADTALGATSVPINSFTPGSTVNSGTVLAALLPTNSTTGSTSTASPLVWPVLSAPLAAGVAVTTVAVNATSGAINSAAKFVMSTGQVATLSAPALSGATSLTVTSFTPNAAIATASTMAPTMTVTITVAATTITAVRQDTAESTGAVSESFWKGSYMDPITSMVDGHGTLRALSRTVP